MKKLIRAIALLTVFCSVILFSGCGSDEGLNYASISEIRKNFSSSVEELKKIDFENLDFSKAEFSFPEIDSICKLSLSSFSGKSAQEIFDFFSSSIDTLVPNKFSYEQKYDKVRFYDGKIRTGHSKQ